MSKFFILTITACTWIFFSCQQQQKENTKIITDKLQQQDDKVIEVDELHKDIELNIHVRHFFEDEEGISKQGVSPWVYSELTDEEKEKYIVRKDFVRHHEFYQLKEGICDNTVKTIDKDTGKIIYRCGGHTSTQR